MVKNNSCIVMTSSNPMKHARELIECGIQSVDIHTKPEDSCAVGSTVLKEFWNKTFQK